MRILFLSSWYPNRMDVHLGNFVQKHAEAVALQSEVAALHILSYAQCKETYEIEQRMINNVFTVNVYYKKVEGNIPLLSVGLRAWRYLNAHFKGWKIIQHRFGKIDLVHHNILYPAGVFALLLKKLYGYPYIITENATEYLPAHYVPFSWTRKMLSRMIARNAYAITPVSADLERALKKQGFQTNYRVVYNVVNTDLFTPGSSITKEKLQFLHISTLKDKQKNISGLLRTIARLPKQRKDFECLFIGDGDATPHIALAKELGIYNSSVFFEGEKSTQEIADAMKNADCLFMFSNYENLPAVIVEALSCGLPVLSSDVGGIAEHIHEYNGILVPPRNEDALLNAFNAMLNNLNSKKYNKEVIREYAVKNFNYIEISNKFHQIYSEALNVV